jgi:hypothetical protein
MGNIMLRALDVFQSKFMHAFSKTVRRSLYASPAASTFCSASGSTPGEELVDEQLRGFGEEVR